MKSNITPSRHLWFLSLLLIILIAKSVSAEVTTKRQDNIVIAVESTIDSSGKNHFSCKLSNQSLHTLVSILSAGEGNSFCVKLLDQNNIVIPQDVSWARKNGQKGTPIHDFPRSLSHLEIHPGTDVMFEFDLEEAYLAKSPLGKKLVISWESYYPYLTTREGLYINNKGEEVLGSKEAYMFPPRWDISVTIPLGIAEGKPATLIQGGDPTLHSLPGPSSKADPSPTLPKSFVSATSNERQDGVVISATLTADPSGKHVVSCTLANQSANTLAAFLLGPPRTNGVFYAKLLDREGNRIPQDPQWASDHRQKEFNYSEQPFSRSIQQINPGSKTQFDFNLEDAYAGKAALGKELLISWESIYFQPTIQTNEYTDAKGNPVPAKEEPYKFLSYWEISTSLPLVAAAEKPALSPPAGQIPVNPTSQNAAPNKPEPTAKNSPTLSHRGWWLLLLIPASLIAYRLTKRDSDAR